VSRSLAAAVVVAVAIPLLARDASANEGITGYSGKPYNGVSETCTTNCHQPSGAAPTLQITVPSSMKAGETAEVTIVVNGTRSRTSMNAALSDGVVAKAGQNTSIPFPDQTPGEVAAVAPPPNGASGTYKFSFVAPQKNGSITLWVAGMSASGSGTGNDNIATTTRTITVTGATAPDPDAGPSSSSGGAPTGDGGATGSPSKDGGASGDEEDDEGSSGGTSSNGSRRRSSSPPEESSCSSAAGRGRAGASTLLVLLAAAALVRRRRRQCITA
jgi:MYXO-CTERM domain-containing protein